jgi:protein gp37
VGDKSHIEWTEATWNPTVGCVQVSVGCDHCYAKRLVEGRMRNRYPGGFGEVVLHADRLDQPLRWRKPRRIFVNSLSDLFEDQVPDGFIAAVWYVMGQCAGCIPEQYRGHIFQILTKRPGRMASWVRRWADVGDPEIPPMDPAAERCGRAELIVEAAEVLGAPIMYDWMDGPRYWPAVLPNVWLGTSVESQKWADVRVPLLLRTPAVVRFISAEPLLGPVELTPWLRPWPGYCQTCGAALWPPDATYCPSCGLSDHDDGAATPRRFARPDWVIVGGESGPGARPMDLEWVYALIDQCVSAEAAVFVKQLGSVWAREHGADPKGGDWQHWAEDLRVREFPRALAVRWA